MKTILLTATTLAFVAGSVSADEMQDMTSSVLAGIAGATGQAAPILEEGETNGSSDISDLIEMAIAEGQSDEYLDSLIAEAVDNGQLVVPDEMKTTTGDVDTRVLIASLVQEAEAATTAQDVEELKKEAGVDKTYEVQPGDSLAAIAITFYGSPSEYSKIFDANRDILDRADLIRVGQVLRIPG
jgi:LysM repeat protein